MNKKPEYEIVAEMEGVVVTVPGKECNFMGFEHGHTSDSKKGRFAVKDRWVHAMPVGSDDLGDLRVLKRSFYDLDQEDFERGKVVGKVTVRKRTTGKEVTYLVGVEKTAGPACCRLVVGNDKTCTNPVKTIDIGKGWSIEFRPLKERNKATDQNTANVAAAE